MTDTQSLSILDQLQQIESVNLDEITFQGTNVRLIAGQRTTFPIEDRTGYIAIPENGMRMTRLTVSDQSGKLVIRGEMILMGEHIGLLGDEDTEVKLVVYTHPILAQWRTYGHAVRWEFQNPKPETVAAMVEKAQAAGWIPFVPTQREGQEVYERAAGVEVKYDLISANGNSSERFKAGIPVASCVIVPDLRVAPNVTEYVNSDQETVQRPAFTSFIDSMVPLMASAIAAGAGDDNRAKQSSLNRMSTLTGYNAENQWPNRPSLGYVTFVGGEELVVFPDRTLPVEGEQAAEAIVAATQAAGDQTAAVVPVADQPFEQ